MKYSGKEKFKLLLENSIALENQRLCWVGDSIIEQGKPAVGNGIGFTTYIESSYPGIDYVNIGVGGNTTKDVIDRISSITSSDADIYVLAIGLNGLYATRIGVSGEYLKGLFMNNPISFN